MQELLVYEKQFLAQGKKIIAGVDEVGRGPLAGPVVVAACSAIFVTFFFCHNINILKSYQSVFLQRRCH